MTNRLFIIAFFSAFILVSCKKSQSDLSVSTTKTSLLKVPTGFTWENSRNINFTVNVTDTRFQTAGHQITIYDGDPTNGGNLLAKGSATTTTNFKCKLYISNQVVQVYVIKTSPDNSKVIQKIPIGTVDITASIGQ